MAKTFEEKLDGLRSIVQGLGSTLVCFSGGIDSALLLKVAVTELAQQAVALTAVSPSLPSRELDGAREFARSLEVRHIEAASGELSRPDYVKNGPDRCFHCKSELYQIAHQKAGELRLSTISNGTNLDDLGDYRPGLEAAKLGSVRSPLVEAGFTKDDVRRAAEELKIPIFAKPASACLASRLPYGMEVTRERLRQVEQFESELGALGFRLVRVRHHDTIARIEVALDELPRLADPSLTPRIVALGKSLGFRYVTIDLAGYRTGSHNELLVGRALPVLPS